MIDAHVSIGDMDNTAGFTLEAPKPALPPFFRLSLSIDLITPINCDCIDFRSRLVFDGVDANSHKYRTLLKPLLWVSHNFRAVAYSRYCNNFELSLSNMSVDTLEKRYLGVCHTNVDFRTLNYLGYSTHHLAKDITVFLDERTVYPGEALEVISRAPYDGCSFPLARKIAFVFAKEEEAGVDEDIWNDPSRVEANIDALIERIKQMAPSVGEITVQPADRDDIPCIANQHFGYLVSRLYRLASRVEYGYGLVTTDLMRLQLDMVCDLTYISYVSTSSADSAYQFVQLARNNAPTLQYLVLECPHAIDILSLVQDAEGNNVAYPRLLVLKLQTWSDSKGPRRQVFHGAAPFPILQRLYISLECPFDDDTFFRGNAATLEHLSMRLDSVCASMFCEYQVFVPGSHPKLQMVNLWYSNNFISEFFASPADALQFIYSIGSEAAVREYSQAALFVNPAAMPSSLGSHSCIQVLSLPSLRPDLWQAITLIKSLPLLSDLQTSSPSLGLTPDGIDFDTLPEHVISNYSPMGRRFRCWQLNSGYVTDFTELATCVLLLALACPNFDYAVPPSFQRRLFMEMLEKDIDSDRFKPYAPRLRRLLFNGWDESDDTDDDDFSSDDSWESENNNDYPPDTAANIAAFVQRLFGIVEKHTMVTCGSDPRIMYINQESIRDLVHIDYFMGKYFASMMPLVTRNSRTLQSLVVDIGRADVAGLVRGPDGGGYLEYPCMYTLKISSYYYLVPQQKATFKDVVPFPQLLRFSVCAYPFADDVLFRGNAGKLVYLKLRLCLETALMLKKYKVFTPTSHPKLQCVEIYRTPFRSPNTFATVAEYMQFVLSIAPGASVRVIPDLGKYTQDLTPALSMLKDHDYIQVLSLPDMNLSLWDAITLLKLVPLLSDLHTSPMTVGKLPPGQNDPDASMSRLVGIRC
ncbi:hypothetical protein GGI17_004142 [Coemansia sp. S146]|nr:hypothetical protein GGI17_004142 [Coemansia sp. S146]